MSRRTERVADMIQQTLAEMLVREVKDPRIGMVTLTSVAVSPDLRHAKVYFSVLGDNARREEALRGLRSARGFLRSEISHRLKLRVMPELAFEFDPSLEQAERVLRLIRASLPDESDS